MMATRTSSINARAPTHRAIRPASSQKTHRRSLLCRAEDTQTSGTFSLSCVVLFVIVFYAQLVFVLVLVFVLFCLPSWLCPAVFVVRSSSRSCKVHPSNNNNNNNNQADNPFFLTHTYTHTPSIVIYRQHTHTHTHTHLCSPLLLSSLLLIYGIRSGERGDGRNVRGTGVEEPGARARRLLGALVWAVPHDCAAH